MPKTQLEPCVVDRVRVARDRMASEGRLLPKEVLGRYLDRFRAKYGPDVLQGLDGPALLEAMHGRKSRDSLVYWLEFKNDDDFATQPLGSILGGSALKFGIYQAAESGLWMCGLPRSQNVLSLDQAVEVARKQRAELLAAVAVLEAAAPPGAFDPDTADFTGLEAKLRKAMPSLYTLAWSHKYLHVLFPDRIDDYHSYEFQQCFHLVRLLQLPPDGRYAAAQPFLSLARHLEEPVQRTSTVLNELHGSPYRYWRMGTMIDGTSGWEAMRTGGYAAVGWSNLGDLADVANGDVAKDVWAARYHEGYPHEHAATESGQRRQLLDFVRSARERDVVVAADGQSVLGVGVVSGPYAYRTDITPFAHVRPCQWRSHEPWTLDEGIRTTFQRLRDPKNWLAIEERLFDVQIPRTKPSTGPAATKAPLSPMDPMVARVDKVLRRKGQVILCGPPGTGKTYWGERAAFELASRAWLERGFEPRDTGQRAELVSAGAVEMCSFHPAYGYEDFIEGYRPTGSNGGNGMQFELRTGVFKRLCDRATTGDAHRPFFLLVDEINRGDIPRIFGELLSALEWDKRGKGFTLPLSGRPFTVPRNVFVIGTMNTADRSIALLDAALRRRFGFIELMPMPETLRPVVVRGLPLAAWLAELNRRIVMHVGRDARNLQVGHAYFIERETPVSHPDRFVEILQEDVVPLLQEYCYEDFAVLAKILGTKLVSADKKRIEESLFDAARRDELFDILSAAFQELSTTRDAAIGMTSAGDDDDTDPAA